MSGLKTDDRFRTSSNASSNGLVLTRTADNQLNDEGLLTPKDRTNSDGFEQD